MSDPTAFTALRQEVIAEIEAALGPVAVVTSDDEGAATRLQVTANYPAAAERAIYASIRAFRRLYADQPDFLAALDARLMAAGATIPEEP